MVRRGVVRSFFNTRITVLGTIRLIAFVALMLLTGCKKEAPVETPVKDPRTYSWTVDTLAYPGSMGTVLYSIWGSGPSNVYAVGHSEVAGGHMWHYDGKKWSWVRLAVQQGGPIQGGFDLRRIHGFNANDIWVIGSRHSFVYNPPPPVLVESTFVMHFDGQHWREVIHAKMRGGLQAIGGLNPNDFWVGGASADTVAPFYRIRNGRPEKHPLSPFIWIGSLAGHSPTNMYAMGYEVDRTMPIDSIRYYFQKFDGQGWQTLETYLENTASPPATFSFIGMWMDNTSGDLYSGGFGIFRRSGSVWRRAMSTIAQITWIGGYSAKDLYAVGSRGAVYYSNGNDWAELSGPRALVSNTTTFYGVWSSGTKVFIVGHTGGISYVVRGE